MKRRCRRRINRYSNKAVMAMKNQPLNVAASILCAGSLNRKAMARSERNTQKNASSA